MQGGVRSGRDGRRARGHGAPASARPIARRRALTAAGPPRLPRTIGRCTEAVELLNENGGDINREDSFGLNPLYLANNSVNGEETFRYDCAPPPRHLDRVGARMC